MAKKDEPKIAGFEEIEEKPGPFETKYFDAKMKNKYKPLSEALKKAEKDKSPEAQAAVDAAMNDYCTTEWCSNWDYKKYDIVFYGVSGYTGYLMMQYLKRSSLKIENQEPFTFAFAGRTYEKVKTMVDREFAGTKWADTPILTARYDDLVSVIDMVKSARVILNVAGPYMLTEGELLVDACIWLKTDYVDISGETPHSLKVYDLHKAAKEAGVMVIPSAASAGGYPDIGVHLCAKKMRDEHGEDLRYASMYIKAGGTTMAPSGGTLKTRAAMNQAEDKVKSAMADPFSMGGFIPDIDRNGVKMINIAKGTGHVTCKLRQEDMDANLSRVAKDDKVDCWRAPFNYAFFETRVVRRANMLMAEYTGQPYGYQLGYQEFTFMPDEKTAKAMLKAGAATSVAEEKKKLEAAGQYYAQGDGPSLEQIADAWMCYNFYAETPSGKTCRLSFRDQDGYYATARMAIEMCMTLRFDRQELPFKGGCLTPATAGSVWLAKRITNTGSVLTMDKWEDVSHLAPPGGFKKPEE